MKLGHANTRALTNFSGLRVGEARWVVARVGEAICVGGVDRGGQYIFLQLLERERRRRADQARAPPRHV